MSRRHPGVNRKRPSGAELALGELCVKLGYCLPANEQDAILSKPPLDADAFVDAVLIAEGRDPYLISKLERRPMVEIATRLVYNDSEHRQSQSRSSVTAEHSSRRGF